LRRLLSAQFIIWRIDMNKKEKVEEQIGILFKVVDKLEQRISTLEKVLESHAKCIGELREDKNDI